MRKLIDEFREFALKGNVLDMAIGIIIGGAFGTIVQSLVKDVMMPPIGLLIGDVDFSDIKVPLHGPVQYIASRLSDPADDFAQLASREHVGLTDYVWYSGLSDWVLREQLCAQFA